MVPKPKMVPKRRALITCLITQLRRLITQLRVLVTLLLTRGPHPVGVQSTQDNPPAPSSSIPTVYTWGLKRCHNFGAYVHTLWLLEAFAAIKYLVGFSVWNLQSIGRRLHSSYLGIDVSRSFCGGAEPTAWAVRQTGTLFVMGFG